MYKPPEENFFEKALWPKISPSAYYRNFRVPNDRSITTSLLHTQIVLVLPRADHPYPSSLVRRPSNLLNVVNSKLYISINII